MRKLFLILILLAAVGYAVWRLAPEYLDRFLPRTDRTAPVMQAAPDMNEDGRWIAAPGRVEPVSEEIRLAFEISGFIEEVLVNEGDSVSAGQPVAQLRKDDYEAQLRTAENNAEAARFSLELLERGARTEEIREARAVANRARTVMLNSRREAERRRELAKKGVLNKEEAEQAQTNYHVASAQYEEAMQRLSIALAQSRPEELERAQAEYDAASSRVDEAKAQLEKTVLRSPLSGVVLRRHRHPGENVSIFFDSPVLTVGDISSLNVRADVNETDIARVRVGQKAYVVADAFGDRRFPGRVVRVARMLGHKNFRTESPTEKNDTKILEVLIALDQPQGLVTGLLVDAYIDAESRLSAAPRPAPTPTSTSIPTSTPTPTPKKDDAG